MRIADYLDSIEGTEQEAALIKSFAELANDEDVAQALSLPVVGKILSAIAALGDSESIADFKLTGHYENIKEWGISVFDLEKGYCSIHPGPNHLKKVFTVMAVAGAGLLLFKLLRKGRK